MQVEYSDSADFTADLDKLQALLEQAANIMGTPKWAAWMRATDRNFPTEAVTSSRQAALELGTARDSVDALAHMLYDAA